MGKTALKRSWPGGQGRNVAREMRSVKRNAKGGIEAMAKRKRSRKAVVGNRADAAAPLRKALASRSKAELASTLLELAKADRGVLRQLTAAGRSAQPDRADAPGSRPGRQCG